MSLSWVGTVTTSPDDGYVDTATGQVVTDTATIPIVPGRPGVFRFAGVPVEPDGQVTAASVRIPVTGTRTDATYVNVYGVAADDVPQLADLPATPPLTSASLLGVPIGASVVSSTRDVTAIVQEITDRPGWQAGNAIVLWYEHASGTDAHWDAVDGGQDRTSKLTLTYDPPANLAPTARFTAVMDGATVTVDATASTDPEGGPLTVSVSLGDGTTKTGPVVTHTYPAGGDYTIEVTVTDDGGKTGTATKVVSVLHALAAGTIVGRTATLRGSATPTTGHTVTAWTWDLGDGTTATGPTVTHTYRAAGTYTAILTVTDTAGRTATAATTVATIEVTEHTRTPTAWAAALAAPTRTTSAMVEVLDERGNVLETLGGPDGGRRGVVSGSVTCDGDRAVRWTCDLTVTDPALVPAEITDLLHPLAHNRVRLWWLVQLADGTWGRACVGTCYPSAPRVSDSAGGGFSMTLGGEDAAREIARAGWDRAMAVAGMTNSAAIETILADRAPWAQFRVTPTSAVLPTDYELGATGADPWEDVRRIAEAAGMVAYVDRWGTVVVEPARTAGPPVAQFVEGPDCTVTDLSRELSLDDLANVVIVEADSNDVPAEVYARSEDHDPSSPLALELGHRYFPDSAHIRSAEVTTVEQAQAMADAERARRRALVEMVEITHRALPTLDPGDTVSVGRARAGVGGMFQVASWSLALGAGSGQRTVMNDRRVML